jgi:hypothetical protein
MQHCTFMFLYPANLLALKLRSFHVQLISQSGIHGVTQDDGKTQTPDEGDGIKKVCIARAGIYPQMVEGGAEEGCIENAGGCQEGVAHDCRPVNGLAKCGGIGRYLRGNKWRNNGTKDRYKAASAILGYGVKIAKTPVKQHATNKGCL